MFEGTGDEVIHADRLSGELFTPLEEQGIEFELFGTQFYQGIARGGEEKDWTYGGKLDYLMRIDGARIGLWKDSPPTFMAKLVWGRRSMTRMVSSHPAILRCSFGTGRQSDCSDRDQTQSATHRRLCSLRWQDQYTRRISAAV